MKFKRLSFLPVLLLVFAAAAAGQTNRLKASGGAREKRELIRLTNEISRASTRSDAATLERLMDDRFVMLAANGKYYRKRALIEYWTKKDPASDASETSVPSETEVFLYGTTAIVVSVITDIERRAGGETVTRTQAFDVWQKTKKGWRWISSRETLPANENEKK